MAGDDGSGHSEALEMIELLRRNKGRFEVIPHHFRSIMVRTCAEAQAEDMRRSVVVSVHICGCHPAAKDEPAHRLPVLMMRS